MRASVGNEEKSVRKEADGSMDTCTDPPSCAACGESPGNLKRCTGCSSVWYCNETCQKVHRESHKKECKRIAGQFADEQEIKRAKALEPLDEKDLLTAFLPTASQRTLRRTTSTCSSTIWAAGTSTTWRVALGAASPQSHAPGRRSSAER